ncbi:MAG TPA: arginyltransferase [Terriglobales bacterium]|nr:arginyltransferase [Terriglobales bacterium]
MKRLTNDRRLSPAPSELLVHDSLTTCPYLPGQVARLPMRLPVRGLRPAEFSERLAGGDRRQGLLLYRPACPMCRACIAVRLDVEEFVPNRTQRRILKRDQAVIDTRIGPPRLSRDRVELYNRHKIERGLLTNDGLIRAEDYEEFLIDSCAETFELAYYVDNRLIGVAIVDRAADALSAVYCYFDPAQAKLSPGTYSILRQVELCRRWGLRYLYLGLYVAGCDALAYKINFHPHERLIDGRWCKFD